MTRHPRIIFMTRRVMAIAKENDLVSSIYIVKILYQEVLWYCSMLCFCEMYFVFGCAKHNFIISL